MYTSTFSESKKIVIAVASSGIASLLLPGGRTAHSRFKIPIKLGHTSTCNIKVQSPEAELIKRAALILWDEAPMTHRHAYEAADRSLRDITKVDLPFGGKPIVSGGDFRQILPVIINGTDNEIVDACLNQSTQLWPHIKVFKLTINMRVQQLIGQDQNKAAEFCEFFIESG